MKHMMPVLIASFALVAGPSLYGQENATTRARTDSKKTDTAVSYGRVKELTAGQKIVIDVDNAVDKSFDLADKDLKVTLGKGLKVGDPVKVTEHEVLGKTKSVMIAKHSGGGVAHGDKDPNSKKP